MTVDTAKVTGRRGLRFESLDEIAEEAERIVATPQVRTLGNWSIGQILRHLAAGMHMSIDGSKHRSPWYFRWLGPLVKRRVLTRGMSAGFNLPRPMAATLIVSDDVSAESGLTALRDALRRLKREARSASRAARFLRQAHAPGVGTTPLAARRVAFELPRARRSDC